MGFRVGYYQFAPAFGRVQENLDRVARALRGCEADLVVLPELALTGYQFADRAELLSLAEDPQHSRSVERLVALCAQEGCYLVTGFAERGPGETCYNSALLLGPEGLLHVYRKLHLFGTEWDVFTPGDVPLQVQMVRGVRVGLMVCFDWAFPEVARALALRGADLLCHPANLVLTYCQQAMLTRCLENGVLAVTANRCGAEVRPHGTLAFTGQSQVAAPHGELIHRAPPEADELFLVEVDPACARAKYLTARNHLLADRRPEYYGDLCGDRVAYATFHVT